jgi:hypothetical protein
LTVVLYSTGVVADIAQRCEIYRDRIAKHFEALQAAAIAKARNEKRHVVHAAEKAKVKELSKNMLSKQCWDACQLNSVEGVLQIVHRGCNPNEESPRGLTPLATLVMNDAQIENVEELLTLKANINFVNRYGFSSLMLACRMNNNKMVHILMRSGASALQKVSCMLHITSDDSVIVVGAWVSHLLSCILLAASASHVRVGCDVCCCRTTRTAAQRCTGAWSMAVTSW